MLLLIGVVVGLLFNPVTGPETRRWLKDKLFGGRRVRLRRQRRTAGSAGNELSARADRQPVSD